MNAFRLLLVAMIATLGCYTMLVGLRHGWDLVPIFVGDIARLTWPGQFNLDFSCFLVLSGTWLAWRHHFSPVGLVLGALGLVGGTAVLAPYLLIASFQVGGNARALLLGARRAAA